MYGIPCADASDNWRLRSVPSALTTEAQWGNVGPLRASIRETASKPAGTQSWFTSVIVALSLDSHCNNNILSTSTIIIIIIIIIKVNGYNDVSFGDHSVLEGNCIPLLKSHGDRRWKRNSVSLVSSVTTVISLPISCLLLLLLLSLSTHADRRGVDILVTVCLFVWLRISLQRIKLAAANFAR